MSEEIKKYWFDIFTKSYQILDEYVAEFNKDNSCVTFKNKENPYPTMAPQKDELEGYKPLKNGEIIKKGDKFKILNKNSLIFIFEASTEIGKPYLEGIYRPGFRKIKEYNFTEEQKNKAINHLKNSRAFNEDSALKVNNSEIDLFDYLFENKLIGCFENRFFIKE